MTSMKEKAGKFSLSHLLISQFPSREYTHKKAETEEEKL